MAKGDRHFDFWMPYEDGEVRVKGTLTKYFPARTNCANEDACPAEGGEIEDFKAWKIIDGKEVETEDTDLILKDLEDAICERVNEE